MCPMRATRSGKAVGVARTSPGAVRGPCGLVDASGAKRPGPAGVLGPRHVP